MSRSRRAPARLADAEWGTRGRRVAFAWGSGRSPSEEVPSETSRGARGAAGEDRARARSSSAGSGTSHALAFPSVWGPGIR